MATVEQHGNQSLLSAIHGLRDHVSALVVGQPEMVERMLIALLCDGHLLVEGAPGLAKTRAIKVLSDSIESSFHRLQFTPDLLPADLTGTDIFRPQDGTFEFRPGPLFHNLILADEINRAPAKVQSALLEAMEERQITVGEKTYSLPGLFLVMATQNPIEQEGTYPLPEAQLDRFLLHVNVSYPDRDAERSILRINRSEALNGGGVPAQASSRVPEAVILAARKAVLELHLADSLEDYILEIVLATRDTARYGDDLDGLLQYGASPRASIALDRASRARAWLNGRDFVTPDDIQNVAPSVLRHRVLLSFEAEAEGYDADTVLTRLLERIAVP